MAKVLSYHLQEQIADRGIPISWVFATLDAPDWTEPDPIAGRIRYFRAIAEFGNRVLRVAVETQGAHITVLTAHFDRAATKRRASP